MEKSWAFSLLQRKGEVIHKWVEIKSFHFGSKKISIGSEISRKSIKHFEIYDVMYVWNYFEIYKTLWNL